MFRSMKHYCRSVLAALVLVLGLLVPTSTPQAQSGGNPGVIPPNARPYGMTYAQLSAKWWKWGLELPVAGHPFIGCPNPPDAGQSGPVWFLAGGPSECALTLPAGKALFFPLATAECSSLEDPPFHGDTAAEQRICAQFWADQIDVSTLFCEIDGGPLQNLARYRVVSPQYTFTAPNPWIFGPAGAGMTGTSVGDGYYLLLAPLSVGAHTIHFGSSSFGIDTTYHLTVAP